MSFGRRLGPATLLGTLLFAAAAGPSAVRAAPPLSDAEMERVLREGRVIEVVAIGTGVTEPRRLLLEFEGRTWRAAFKDVEMEPKGITHFGSGLRELNFTDSFRYERAAYLLDRELGMNMVPVTVLRQVRGREGAAIAWIEDAVDERTLDRQALSVAEVVAYARQRKIAALFDALIFNTDRNLGNLIITPADGRMHLIDHSRAFRMSARLPESFEELQIRLPRALYERLAALEEDRLKELLGKHLSLPRIRALLSRRDHIVQRIEERLRQVSDHQVFFEWPVPLTQP